MSRAGKRFALRFECEPCVALWSADVLATSAADRELVATIQAWLRSPRPGQSRKAIKAAAEAAGEIAELLAASVQQDATPFAVLTVGELLLRRPDAFSPESFTAAWQTLATIDPNQWDDIGPPAEPETARAVAYAVAHGEIPWMLGLLLSPLKRSKALLKHGRAALREALDNATDSDGTLHAAVAERAGEWLAPLVRASAWAQAFGEDWWTKSDAARFNRVIRKGALLVTSAGIATELTAQRSADDQASTQRILSHAAVLGEFAASSPTAKLLTEVTGKRPKKSRQTQKAFPGEGKGSKANSFQSDWAALAVLRSSARPSADLATLAFDRPVPKLSLAALGVPILAGDWTQNLLIDSRQITTSEEWACSCWFRDQEVAFVELTRDIAQGVQAVRHVMVSMLDHFAVVCESVTCPEESARIEFESRLRLSPGRTVETDPVTRELLLHGDDVIVRVIPAWLDDDRVVNTPGSCVQDGEDLRLTAEGVGGVTVPMLFDWHPKRRVREADWNRVTVTENRVVQSGWQAAGFRVRIGRLQLLLYRSLQKGATLRAVLGHHTNNETVYGHVGNSGEIKLLVLVDGELEDG